MTINYREEAVLAATTLAVDWQITVYDNVDMTRISLRFDTAPTTGGSVAIYKIPQNVTADKTLLIAESAVGATTLTFENIQGLIAGDVIEVTYANADARSITGFATTYSGV